MSDVSYKPLMEEWTWSHSRISAYDNCPYGFFCHYILDEEEEPMFYSSYGSFMHKLFEKYFKNELSSEDLSSEFMCNFTDEVEGERPQESTVEKYINSSVDFLDDFNGFGLQTIAVEKPVEFHIGKYKMQGYIDYVGRDDDGNLYIVDHKSRELKPRSNRKKPTQKDVELDEVFRQLYLYSASIFEESGEWPAFLCINSYRSGAFIKEQFCREKFDEICESVEREIDAIMEDSDFYPRAEYYKCRYLCGFHNTCEYYDMMMKEMKHG